MANNDTALLLDALFAFNIVMAQFLDYLIIGLCRIVCFTYVVFPFLHAVINLSDNFRHIK